MRVHIRHKTDYIAKSQTAAMPICPAGRPTSVMTVVGILLSGSNIYGLHILLVGQFGPGSPSARTGMGSKRVSSSNAPANTNSSFFTVDSLELVLEFGPCYCLRK